MSSKVFLAAAAGIVLAALPSRADVTLIPNPADYGASPAVFTLDPEAFGPAQRGVTGTRNLRQTFQLADSIFVENIVLSLALNGTDGGLVIDFYEIADVGAGSWSAGTLVHTITLPTTVDLPSTTARLQLQLSGADIFSLTQRNTGNEGYGIEVSNADDVSGIGNFRHSNDGTEHFTQGRFYTESGSPSGTGRDLGVALSGTIIPEPAAFSLLGFGALGLLLFRRKTR
jgi:hypothetical protein